MNYYLQFHIGSKEHEIDVNPAHIRDAHVGETVMLDTFFPDLFKHKTFSKISQIEIEKGKRVYKLSIDYRQSIEK